MILSVIHLRQNTLGCTDEVSLVNTENSVTSFKQCLSVSLLVNRFSEMQTALLPDLVTTSKRSKCRHVWKVLAFRTDPVRSTSLSTKLEQVVPNFSRLLTLRTW